jgi:hypothetical protein
VEAHALGTFIGYDVIVIIRNGHYFIGGIHNPTATIQFESTFDRVAIADSPFYTTFIDGIVRTFWFASTAVDTFIGNHYCHNNFLFFIERGPLSIFMIFTLFFKIKLGDS